MVDSIGQPLAVGDYVLIPGSGNKTAEYGMILHKITKIDHTNERVRTERLLVGYHPSTITRGKSSLTATQRMVKIDPPANMIALFEKPDLKHFELISNWIHGRVEIDWDTLTLGRTLP